MSAPDLTQIFQALGQGVAVIDGSFSVLFWNAWMERASGIGAAEAVGRSILELFPGLDEPAFRRSLRAVLSLGIVSRPSRRIHGDLFPFRPAPGSPEGFELMQQRCEMGPIVEGGAPIAAYIIVADVTDAAARERELSELAMRDVLTSAYNRRFLDRRLAEELDRSSRYGRILGLAMIDIDHFKRVNDEHGHQFGDQALRQLVKVCSAAIRAADVFARYGGEEFCLLLPETGLDEARALADRLRLAVSERPVEFHGRGARLTVSAGVAASREGDGPDDLLRRADSALYAAKGAGRDRVEISA